MLETVELPAGITNLDSGLADVNTEINQIQCGGTWYLVPGT